MSKVIVIFAIDQLDTVQQYVDDNGIEFETHLWRKGIPDPPIIDLEHAIKCAPTSSEAPTHLMIWGELTVGQDQGLNGLAQCQVFNAANWTRRAVLENFNLVRVVDAPEQTFIHHLQMPLMHKIWDYADEPWDHTTGAVSDKWDGHTCGVRYNNGNLVRGLTQGDNISGHDRTVRLAQMVPATLNQNAHMQIEGEVITNSNSPVDAYNAMYGTTRREFAALAPKFIAFDLRVQGDHPFTTWTQAMTWLSNQGFDTVLNYSDPDYPKDGVVYRIDNYVDYKAAAIGQFAFKFGDQQ
jgi:hypothetical protein